MKKVDIKSGSKFGNFTVLNEVENSVVYGRKRRVFRCRCECGNEETILLGLLKNRNLSYCKKCRRIAGVGVNNYDGDIQINGNLILSYRKWSEMLRRCYSNMDRYKAYKNCTVCDEWLYFSNFKRWFDENYNPETMQGYHLDKDILSKNTKIYSPETCCFVPECINLLFLIRENKDNTPNGIRICKKTHKYTARIHINNKTIHLGTFKNLEDAFDVYSKAKKDYIKQMAEDYFAKGKITKRVYEALITYNFTAETEKLLGTTDEPAKKYKFKGVKKFFNTDDDENN